MIGFSQTVGYAIRALACIPPLEAAEPARIGEIAKRTRIPRPYLARVLHRLAAKRLVVTKRGRAGGLYLPCPPLANLREKSHLGSGGARRISPLHLGGGRVLRYSRMACP